MKNIDSKDISIVVQGPVIGKESDPSSFHSTKGDSTWQALTRTCAPSVNIGHQRD